MLCSYQVAERNGLLGMIYYRSRREASLSPTRRTLADAGYSPHS